jgi:transcriptional regulator with XRE-family HTH domain
MASLYITNDVISFGRRPDMTGAHLKSGREQKGWTQQEAASRLRVSQPYLSLMEKGMRRVPQKLARKAASAFGLSVTTLPVEKSWESAQPKDANTLAADLASLGYPGFAYLKPRRKKNPGEVLLSALSAKCLESRVAEALPWLLLTYPELDWDLLMSVAKARDLQNRLGLVTCFARRVAERLGENHKAELLRSKERALERSRLFVEDTLCDESLTQAERRWLDINRSDEAKYWRVLTDLSVEHLNYAG